jgi:hypothetical protein
MRQSGALSSAVMAVKALLPAAPAVQNMLLLLHTHA